MEFNILNISLYLLDFNILLLMFCIYLFFIKWSSYNYLIKIFVCYLIFATVIQLVFRMTFSFSTKNWILTNVFLIGQMFFNCYYFFNLFKNKPIKLYIKISGFIFLVITLLQYSLNYNLIFKLNEICAFQVSFCYIICTIFYFYQTIDVKGTFYFICIGGLIYHFESIFVFLIAKLFINQNLNSALIIYCIHTFFAIMYTLFVIKEWSVSQTKNVIKK